MPAGLDPAVPADHRRRDRDHLHEHHLITGADLRGAGHNQRRPVTPGREPAGRRHQIRRAYRDHRRGASQPGVISGALTRWHGGQRRSAVELHVGLLCEDWRQTPRLLQEPHPHHLSRHAR